MYVYIHLSHTWTNPDNPRTLSFYVQEIFKDEILWCGSLRSDLETGTLKTIYLSATSVSWSWSWLVRVTTLFQMEAFTIWVNFFSTSQNIAGWFFHTARMVQAGELLSSQISGEIPWSPSIPSVSSLGQSWSLGEFTQALAMIGFQIETTETSHPTPALHLSTLSTLFFRRLRWNRRCQSVVPAPLCLENWPGEISVAVGLWPVDCLF